MFLDDKLYQIGISKSKRPEHWRDKTLIINEMIEECECYLTCQSNNGEINKLLLDISLKRMKSHWTNAVDKLKKEGCNFVKADGLTYSVDIRGKHVDVILGYKP